MTSLEDVLLARQARLSRMLAGLALAWPSEVVAAVRNDALLTDERARRFIERLRKAGAANSDGALALAGDDAAQLAIWLIEASANNDFSEGAAQRLANELMANMVAIRVLQNLKTEVRDGKQQMVSTR